MADKTTCVQTKAFQHDENLFSLKQGSSACINITILCKVGGIFFCFENFNYDFTSF